VNAGGTRESARFVISIFWTRNKVEIARFVPLKGGVKKHDFYFWIREKNIEVP